MLIIEQKIEVVKRARAFFTGKVFNPFGESPYLCDNVCSALIEAGHTLGRHETHILLPEMKKLAESRGIPYFGTMKPWWPAEDRKSRLSFLGELIQFLEEMKETEQP